MLRAKDAVAVLREQETDEPLREPRMTGELGIETAKRIGHPRKVTKSLGVLPWTRTLAVA